MKKEDTQGVHVQELMKKVDESIARSSIFEFNPQDLAKALTPFTYTFFAQLKERGVITSFAVSDAKVVHNTWQTLYPGIVKRLLARLAYKLHLGDSCSPKWYHLVLPYTVIKSVQIDQAYFENDVPKEEVYWYMHDQYEATIRYPFDEICQDIAVHPIAPINRINITLKA